MSVSERILSELEALSEAQRAEVLDFARFLRQRSEREIDALAK